MDLLLTIADAHATSVSLVYPTNELTVEIIERAIGTESVTAAHLIANLAAAILLSHMHGTRGGQTDTKIHFRRDIRIGAGRRGSYDRIGCRRPSLVEQDVEIADAVRRTEVVGRHKGRQEDCPGD